MRQIVSFQRTGSLCRTESVPADSANIKMSGYESGYLYRQCQNVCMFNVRLPEIMAE